MKKNDVDWRAERARKAAATRRRILERSGASPTAPLASSVPARLASGFTPGCSECSLAERGLTGSDMPCRSCGITWPAWAR